MQNPRLASRYAKSLLDLAVERNCLEDTLSDVQLLDRICRVSRDFEVMLRSPVITTTKKASVINAVVDGKMHPLTVAFINLLAQKGRESVLPEIALAFIDQYNQMKNIRTVNVTTAVPMDDTMKSTVLNKVASLMPGYSVNLVTAIDDRLIGGFVLEVEGKLFDASVRKKLNDIKSNIVDYSYVSKM